MRIHDNAEKVTIWTKKYIKKTAIPTEIKSLKQQKKKSRGKETEKQ